MNRYEAVIRLPGGEREMIDIARLLVMSLEECAMEGMHPQKCPAVQLLGAILAFHTHLDVPVVQRVDKLTAQCVDIAAFRAAEPPVAH